ncbi:metalloregulator ArsR/SmtB family transcription factor [Chelativorans sp. AA-79]|uniref:ArsR/SmtB family transcription factor n=1 Tax=Chelativorans sp. AA-79 TaxID=3028735 RepID=UPI0023F74DCC|nr:metalloregulator ArsR/SmtB family transcription factor [Chelativorans sp. AA-79]WEX07649.1 metalloregulator ArsR/SmtB family transcription factor [Chelativorans sp. AA-79]
MKEHDEDLLSMATGCCAPEALARGLAALSHPARIEILRQLAAADACCCKDVAGRLPLAQSTVSQHLKVLLDAGLVRMRPQAQRSNYTIDREALLALSRAFNGLVSDCMAASTAPSENGKS